MRCVAKVRSWLNVSVEGAPAKTGPKLPSVRNPRCKDLCRAHTRLASKDCWVCLNGTKAWRLTYSVDRFK